MCCAEGAHEKDYRYDRMESHINSMPLPEELDPIKYFKKNIRNLNLTVSAEVNYIFSNGSFFFLID